ncbi:hypothetical protein K491DRAFT_776839 [Lophiostoma macrostomum CBS 122681]|uniref:Uncharacterized protein n=1 Tax=Lophiostoma macrostomum CBS 122681 TaxID=1314788 RepID=A0A6A6TD65_9PLEO|nr:hypothetical protein K491DRAFT_776839 [Lophiostoma macrostomum CBS 122681]
MRATLLRNWERTILITSFLAYQFPTLRSPALLLGTIAILFQQLPFTTPSTLHLPSSNPPQRHTEAARAYAYSQHPRILDHKERYKAAVDEYLQCSHMFDIGVTRARYEDAVRVRDEFERRAGVVGRLVRMARMQFGR